MAEFKSMTDCDDPMEVLMAPMELGLIPKSYLCVTNYDPDASLNDIEDERKPAHFTQVERELFDRFLVGLQSLLPSNGCDPVELEDLYDVAGKQRGQRTLIASALCQKFPGLNTLSAIEAHTAEYAYENLRPRAQERWDILRLFLEYGYKPPLAASELLDDGTRNAGEGKVCMPLGIAEKVANSILSGERTTSAIERKLRSSSSCREVLRTEVDAEKIASGRKDLRVEEAGVRLLKDRIKNRAVGPWPEGLLDRHYRYHLLNRAAANAYKRAYDQFFFFSQVEVLVSVDADGRKQWLAVPAEMRAEHAQVI